MKKIVITGGLGYIGTELCKIYSGYSWNDQITVIDNRFISERVNQIRKWNMQFVHGDILDKELVKKIFKDAVVGLSDHTLSNHTCLASVALGARVLERHFIDKKSRKGPDVSCSMTPIELKDLIEGSKNIFLSLKGNKELVKEEIVTARFAFGSVSATQDIKKGEISIHDSLTYHSSGPNQSKERRV